MRLMRILPTLFLLFLGAVGILFQVNDKVSVLSDSTKAGGNSVPILMYHKVSPASPFNGPGMRVSPGEFEKQMRYLRENGYTTISLGQLWDSRKKGTALPNRPVVITFDDGYEDNYTYAFPILKKYKQKATIFLVYDRVGGYNEWDAKTSPARRQQLLTWPQIKKMQRNGISFESHTLTHPRLAKIPPEDAAREIILSKKRLAKALGKPVEFIAYPYGSNNREIREMVRIAGYKAAVTTVSGTTTPKDNLFYLKRQRVNADVSIEDFKRLVNTSSGI